MGGVPADAYRPSLMSMRSGLSDLRTMLLVLAALTLAPVFARPTVPYAQPVLEYLFVVDITQSMNVRDYLIRAQPIDRLTFVKSALIEVIQGLPCGSLVGLGIFTGWQTEVLVDPIEVCHHRREIEDVVRHIDWRMTWTPQSNVARGLEDALNKLPSDAHGALVFFTDGDEAPDYGMTPASRGPRRKARPRGVAVGVGDLRPSAIPLLNPQGRMTGYFQQEGQPYLSSLKQDYLRKLGRANGLDYHRLRTPNELLDILRSDRYAHVRPVRRDVSWAFGAGALSLLTFVYALTPLRRWQRVRRGYANGRG
jgi:mxaL protein